MCVWARAHVHASSVDVWMQVYLNIRGRSYVCKYYCDWKIECERIEKDLIKTNAFVFLYKSEMTVVVL